MEQVSGNLTLKRHCNYLVGLFSSAENILIKEKTFWLPLFIFSYPYPYLATFSGLFQGKTTNINIWLPLSIFGYPFKTLNKCCYKSIFKVLATPIHIWLPLYQNFINFIHIWLPYPYLATPHPYLATLSSISGYPPSISGYLYTSQVIVFKVKKIIPLTYYNFLFITYKTLQKMQ